MKNDIPEKLANLRRQIASENYPLEGMREWRGADVMIRSQVNPDDAEWSKNQPIVISPQETDPMRRVVVTEYALELSWLFVELGKVFSEQIDYVSKYDFYGSLAQAAIDHISRPEGNTDAKELLNAVLGLAEKFCVDDDC